MADGFDGGRRSAEDERGGGSSAGAVTGIAQGEGGSTEPCRFLPGSRNVPC